MKKRVGLQEMIFMLQEMILIWIKLMNWKILYAGNDSDLDKAHELEDFVNKMSKPISKEDKRKIKVSERFDRCSSGEY